jgi:hypothetical protein
MSTTGVNGWHFPSYSDSPDIPRDLGILGEDIAAYIAAHPGPQGDTGPRGYSVLNGTSDPISSTGIDGDFYINTTSHSIFGPKTSGAWGSGTSLGGNSVLNGSTDPSIAIGSNGDFYINTTSKTIFGPKTSGAWGSGTSLVGPTGATGSTGATGAKGDAAATISVHSTTTGAAGTNASVTNSGTSSAVLLDFVIPRGADGATGATGATGPQGPAGATPSLDPISTRISLTIPNTSSTGVNSDWYPLSTGFFNLGKDATSGTARYWKNIYSNGTIYTASVIATGNMYINTSTIVSSDQNLKNNIVPSNLGLDFINSLNPVSYKYNVGGIDYSIDDDGNEIETIIPGVRTHYGLIAQQVKQALDDAGVEDFGGWVQKEDNTQALRYEEFISPLIKAVQELTARVKALEEA